MEKSSGSGGNGHVLTTALFPFGILLLLAGCTIFTHKFPMIEHFAG